MGLNHISEMFEANPSVFPELKLAQHCFVLQQRMLKSIGARWHCTQGSSQGEWDMKSALTGFLPVPTLTQMPLHSNPRRHLLQLAIKLSRGTGCQTCAAGDYWLGASSQFGTTQREPKLISAGVLPSCLATAKGPPNRRALPAKHSWVSINR